MLWSETASPYQYHPKYALHRSKYSRLCVSKLELAQTSLAVESMVKEWAPVKMRQHHHVRKAPAILNEFNLLLFTTRKYYRLNS